MLEEVSNDDSNEAEAAEEEEEVVYEKQDVKDEEESETIKYESYYFDQDPDVADEELDSAVIIENDEYQMEVIVDDTKEIIHGARKNPKPVNVTAIKPRVERDYYNNGNGFLCDICQKVFKDKSKLKVHREIHTDERNVICPVSLLYLFKFPDSKFLTISNFQECGKGFKTMNCLRNHKRMHLPDRVLFGCDQCDKKYTQKVQLKKHFEIVHMNRRDYECQACFASFGTKSVLKMHMLSHTNQRNEVCTGNLLNKT